MSTGSVKSSGRSSSSIRIKSIDRSTKSSTQSSISQVPPAVDQAAQAKARQVVGADQVSGAFSVPAGARRGSGLTEGKRLATEVILRFIAMSMNPETLDRPKEAPTTKAVV
jgi:hypothetical protein